SLKKYLKSRKKPDVIYCSIPSIDGAYTAAKYAKSNNIPFIIDVQDLWPEAFTMALNIPFISNLLFYPMSKKVNFAYSVADEIIGVSKTFANRALLNNKKCKSVYSVPLGTDLNYFDMLSKENKANRDNNSEIWLGYVGTLGHAYDI